ncbi:hypothetical protein [Sporolactobacillus pectinivorans]|uniref:hypothetical protein n=1 Tax=Sporolactobacillus pectinivorans TaxID=1591408 RepID=UPI000C26916A|nr:hypothetical protein [Sporolactobacillus pectinivorans]
MNPGQEKFFNFIMERIQDGKQDETKALLNESFSKQADGTFNAEYLTSFATRMIALLKPAYVDEVKTIMSQFGPGFTK